MIRNERHALIVVGTSYKLAPAGGSILLKGAYLGDLINPYAWYDSFKSSQWAYIKKFVPANKNLWDQIMKSCEEGNFEIDEYSYKIE